MVTKEIYIFMISKTKLDDSFPISQFLIKGLFTPFRIVWNKDGGRILLYIWNHITSTQLKKCLDKNLIDAFSIEIRITMKSSKWLICNSDNPNKLQISLHHQELSTGIDTYITMKIFHIYEWFQCRCLLLFCNQHKLKSLNKDLTCHKNFNNPYCIGLLL